MKKTQKKSVIIGVISLVIIIVLGVLFYTVFDRTEALRRTEIENTVQAHYNLSKLEFCYNSAVTPCTDEQITKWNAANPNNSFELKDFKTLMQTAEEAYANTLW